MNDSCVGIREDRAAILDLASRVEAGEGADRELDLLVICAVTGRSPDIGCPAAWLDERELVPVTASLDAVIELLDSILPGFWWRGGTCYLSSEARVCPDHNCPTHGARLMVECPPEMEHWDEGIEVEIRPGSDGALVRALLAATLKALAQTLPDANHKEPSP